MFRIEIEGIKYEVVKAKFCPNGTSMLANSDCFLIEVKDSDGRPSQLLYIPNPFGSNVNLAWFDPHRPEGGPALRPITSYKFIAKEKTNAADLLADLLPISNIQ